MKQVIKEIEVKQGDCSQCLALKKCSYSGNTDNCFRFLPVGWAGMEYKKGKWYKKEHPDVNKRR